MKQISGYVLVKETGSGVPDLVVTAYDSEKSVKELAASFHSRNAFDLGALGKRIGSVLTDQDGKFILKSEELEFQGNESRPDLLIGIFAPEDIQAVNDPFPLPPEQRVLYISSIPREDAGAEEAYVIRLLQAQLDHFDILVATSTAESERASQRLANAVDSNLSFRDSLRERLKPRLQEEQRKSDEIREIARGKVKNLSAIPQYLRDDNSRNIQLLINGKKDLAESLNAKQDQAIEGGLKRFETRSPVLRIALTKDDLEDLGLQEQAGKMVGEVDSEKLAEKVRSLTKGVDLVRLRDFHNPSPEELERKYLTAKPLASARRLSR